MRQKRPERIPFEAAELSRKANRLKPSKSKSKRINFETTEDGRPDAALGNAWMISNSNGAGYVKFLSIIESLFN
ncbi:hypothetical protein CJP46_08605 [Paenibacillus sp. XY044]|nr:hypothetical protein CJP46_08605 [Paenibacillus sp. XY044]